MKLKPIGPAEIWGYKDENGLDTGFIKKPGPDHIPIVACFRTKPRGRPSDTDLLHFVCPFCGKEHTHGACGRDTPFGYGDGHRCKHCVTTTKRNEKGYYLKEFKDPESAGYRLVHKRKGNKIDNIMSPETELHHSK